MTEDARPPRIQALGDAALLVTYGERPNPIHTRRADELAAAIHEAGVGGVGRPVAAHASVLVPFDPLAIDATALGTRLRAMFTAARRVGTTEPGDPDAQPIEIPVRYGGPDGPDLEEVAAAHGLRPADVVELHAGARFEVLFLGFAPGFAYLGGLPPSLATPRRATPRERVPAGSVGIAGDHSAVYPLAMPGGWNLIGRTDQRLFDPTTDPPTPLGPGRPVRFVPR